MPPDLLLASCCLSRSDPELVEGLPVRRRWTPTDFALTGGGRIAVMVGMLGRIRRTTRLDVGLADTLHGAIRRLNRDIVDAEHQLRVE